MKNAFIIFIFLQIYVQANAQTNKGKFITEVNLFRISPSLGSFSYYYDFKFTTVNAVKLGYQFSSNSILKFGFGRLNEGQNWQGSLVRRQYYGSGNEFSAGFEQRITQGKKFDLFLEGGAFYEFLKERGEYWSDNDTLTSEINHNRHYYGAVIELKAAYKITGNIAAYYSIRNRLGYGHAKGTLTRDPRFYKIYPSFSGVVNYFEPLNVGLRISFSSN